MDGKEGCQRCSTLYIGIIKEIENKIKMRYLQNGQNPEH